MKKNASTFLKLSPTAKYLGVIASLLTLCPGSYAQENTLVVTGADKESLYSNNQAKVDPWLDTSLDQDAKIDAIVAQMTNKEKASLVVGTGMPGVQALVGSVAQAKQGLVPGAAGGTAELLRFGIPATVLSDGPAGLRIEPTRENDPNTYYATAFPVGTSLASTWNKELLEQVGQAMGNEVKEYGVDVLLAPGMNIHRNPLNGRNFEYYSEDPLIAGKTAAAIVNGIQSMGVGSSIKHFVANNEETNRSVMNVHVSERALRELYLKGFEIAVKESNPWTIMTSYNKVNGEYSSTREDLLQQVLRDEWGFQGIVMTDWFGGFPGFETIKDGKLSDVVKQMQAGNDLLMPGLESQQEAIVNALDSGELSQEAIDANVKRLLKYIFGTPTFAKYKYSNKPDLEKNAQITRNAASEGMILLTNKDNTLPFFDKDKQIALFGVTSYIWNTGGTGSGSVNNKHTVSLLEGLDTAGYTLDQDLIDLYKPFTQKESDTEMQRRADDFARGNLPVPKRLKEMPLSDTLLQEMAQSSDIAFITLGRNSGEGRDRVVDEDFNLALDELEMIDKVSTAFHRNNKKVVVILNIAGVIETASWKDKVDAILLAWEPGQEGGHSVADVISGEINPSGKLTMTFPMKYTDTPSANSFPGIPKDNPTEVIYDEGIYVGYRYFNTFDVLPSFEFGYGKSYTDFTYSDLKISSRTFKDSLTVQVKIKNTGKVSGKEVVQLYLSAPKHSIDKPKMELKAFGKTKELKPGESQVVTMVLYARDLASFVPSKSQWIADKGKYEIYVGASSLNLKLDKGFTLPKDLVIQTVKPAFALDIDLKELLPKK